MRLWIKMDPLIVVRTKYIRRDSRCEIAAKLFMVRTVLRQRSTLAQKSRNAVRDVLI